KLNCFYFCIKGEEKDKLLHFFQIVTDSLFWLLGGHIQLIQNGISCICLTWFIKLCVRNLPFFFHRSKRTKALLELNRQKEEKDLRLRLQLQRQRAMRLSRESRLSMLEIVHPGQLEKYNREMEEKSALTIQKHWRGYRERKNFRQQRPALTEYKAAVTLQRAVLKFLARCRKKNKLFAPWHGLQELTDERRAELKQQVADYIRRHPDSQMSEVASRELHAQAQERLQHYFMGRAIEERAQQHREALMAQISTNIEQLMKAPSLKEAEGKEPEHFLSRSRPVAAKAKQAHLTTLKHIQAPWWKKLGEEPGSSASAPPRTAGQGTPGSGAQPAAPPLGAPPPSPARPRWPPGALRRHTRPGTDTQAADWVVTTWGSPKGGRAGQFCVHGPVSERPVAASLGTQPRTRREPAPALSSGPEQTLCPAGAAGLRLGKGQRCCRSRRPTRDRAGANGLGR
ncbi:IQ calmodulin-binding motif-containing protein 1, partial [Microtus ochrogaster]